MSGLRTVKRLTYLKKNMPLPLTVGNFDLADVILSSCSPLFLCLLVVTERKTRRKRAILNPLLALQAELLLEWVFSFDSVCVTKNRSYLFSTNFIFSNLQLKFQRAVC
jgi:hypothetical protein